MYIVCAGMKLYVGVQLDMVVWFLADDIVLYILRKLLTTGLIARHTFVIIALSLIPVTDFEIIPESEVFVVSGAVSFENWPQSVILAMDIT